MQASMVMWMWVNVCVIFFDSTCALRDFGGQGNPISIANFMIFRTGTGVAEDGERCVAIEEGLGLGIGLGRKTIFGLGSE